MTVSSSILATPSGAAKRPHGRYTVQESPIQAEKQPARWQEKGYQGREQLSHALFISRCAFSTVSLGVRAAFYGQMTAERTEINALTGNYGLHNIESVFREIDLRMGRHSFDVA